MNEKFYNDIKNILNIARNKVYKTANFVMLYSVKFEVYEAVLFKVSK